MKGYRQAIWILLAGLCASNGLADMPDLTKPRVWTAQSGSKLQAILVEADAHQVVLRNRQGQLFHIPRDGMSAEDQALLDAAYGPAAASASTPVQPAASAARAGPEPLAAAPTLAIAGTELNLGGKTVFRLPVSADTRAALEKEKLSASEVVVGLWLPAHFNPGKRWKILLVSATQDSSSVDHMYFYLDGAREAGDWIVLAADGPQVPPANDSTAWRWQLAKAALLALDEAWGGVTGWPIATGGFSGGAKRSGLLGAILVKEKWNLIGMWMGGCNQDFATRGMELYSPSHTTFRKVPIYLSVGKNDDIAPVAKVDKVRRAMKTTGFREVRMETYDGQHDPHLPHVGDSPPSAPTTTLPHRLKRMQ